MPVSPNSKIKETGKEMRPLHPHRLSAVKNGATGRAEAQNSRATSSQSDVPEAAGINESTASPGSDYSQY